jgi:sugar diacid utilization regulator
VVASPQEHVEGGARTDFLDALGEVSDAVESGAGLPSVVRAAAHALSSSVVVLSPAGGILAAARLSPEDERAILANEGATESHELRVADQRCGELRIRPRGTPPAAAVVRMVATLIALEAERTQAPERASEAAVSDFLADLLSRRLTDRDNILARSGELGCDVTGGAGLIVARARPQHPEEGDWRARVLTTAERGAHSVDRASLAAIIELGPARPRPHGPGEAPRPARPDRDLVLLVPGVNPDLLRRAADAALKEMEIGLTGFTVVMGLSRPTPDAADLHRAGAEALLAANVAEARGETSLPFDETGAYRLLLPAMSDDAAELRRFHEETVAPIINYDQQYESELVYTLESFLDADGSVAKTAERLFTHRHTIRYRLERIRDLSGLDVGSSDGRERLSLGLKAMRVLGIAPPGGPARERGTEAGRVPRDDKDR